MNKLTPIAAATLLSACTSMTWVPTENAKVNLRQAQLECQMEAEKVAPTHGTNTIIATAGEQAKMMNLCMSAKGFAQVPTPTSGSNYAHRLADGAAIQVGRGNLCGLDTKELATRAQKAIPAYAASKTETDAAQAHFKRKVADTMKEPNPLTCDKVAEENQTYLSNLTNVGF